MYLPLKCKDTYIKYGQLNTWRQRRSASVGWTSTAEAVLKCLRDVIYLLFSQSHSITICCRRKHQNNEEMLIVCLFRKQNNYPSCHSCILQMQQRCFSLTFEIQCNSKAPIFRQLYNSLEYATEFLFSWVHYETRGPLAARHFDVRRYLVSE